LRTSNSHCHIGDKFQPLFPPLDKGVEFGAFGALRDWDSCSAHEHIIAVAILSEMESIALRADKGD